MPTFYGRNDQSTLKGLREAIDSMAKRAYKETGPYGSRNHSHIRALGEWNGYNMVLSAIDEALRSGPTPDQISATMEREETERG